LVISTEVHAHVSAPTLTMVLPYFFPGSPKAGQDFGPEPHDIPAQRVRDEHAAIGKAMHLFEAQLFAFHTPAITRPLSAPRFNSEINTFCHR